MGKKSRSDHHHASFKGKRPANKAKTTSRVIKNPGRIKNKMKRSEMYGKYLQQKREAKIAAREEREREREEARPQECLGEDVIKAIPVPKTLDNTRVRDVTMVDDDDDDDDEIAAEQRDDEFAPYFRNVNVRPKVLITTRPKPSSQVFYFIADLQRVIPQLHYYPRRVYTIKEICHFASKRNFTHVMVLSEKQKRVNGLTISHLRPPPPPPAPPETQTITSSGGNSSSADEDDGGDNDEEDNTSTTGAREEEEEEEDEYVGTGGGCGPTAFFKLSNVVTSKNIPNHGVAGTSFLPELNLTGFGTRLGQRVGRLLGSLFPAAAAQLEGRQVVTFHNQRDYIFVRQHRYIFEEKKKQNIEDENKNKKNTKKNGAPQLFPVKARLQELGPRFTLKLRWLQEGTFDTKFGEYEWIHKRKEMDTTRRTFHL